jgi:hypothetical protein
LATDLDVAQQVNQLAEAGFIERGARVILGQHALEGGVIALDGCHRRVHRLTDVRLAGLCLQARPARLGRHPEDVVRTVFVSVFWVSALVALGFQLRAMRLEGVGDVLQEDQAQRDMLVLGGVHAAAQRVGGAPKLGFQAEDLIGHAPILDNQGKRRFAGDCLMHGLDEAAKAGRAAPIWIEAPADGRRCFDLAQPVLKASALFHDALKRFPRAALDGVWITFTCAPRAA